MGSRVLIITGASRGLGAAAARIAAQLGAKLVLNARSADALGRVATEIRAGGGAALAVPGDIGQPEVPHQLATAAVEAFGGIDGIVNNAGVLEPIALIGDGERDAWQISWAVNLLGPVMLIQAALPYLRQREGRVINVSSGAAVNAIPTWGAYCVTKAALNHLTRMLAAEEATITAIALRPGAVDTAMQQVIRQSGAGVMPPEWHARFTGYHEHGELLPPEEPGCALAVLALAAPRSWSGQFISWNDDRVQTLVSQHVL